MASSNSIMQDMVVIRRPESVPLGFQFKPADEDLVLEYLKKKIENPGGFHVEFMPDAIIYDCHPEHLLYTYGFSEGNKDAYLFSRREKKFGHGDRANRVVKDGSGLWNKSTSKKPVKGVDGRVIGHKSGLVFFTGQKKSKDGKTNWLMEEYEISDEQQEKAGCSGMNPYDLVLCHIYENVQDNN
ncbi:NAC domain-containing protein 72-like [Papaver somniferum]|uniref:NAC domain-containing protein 72-like n=1 Tax=Papaver somniferum TaxID=3469 RepID=UPI000E6F694D|nr:NAC domain-containing protein 72-like [Papaver somniferum]